MLIVTAPPDILTPCKTVTAEDDELFFDTLLIWEFEISWRPWHWLLMFRHTAFCWLTEAWAYKQSKLQKKICVHLAVLRLVGACSLLICWSLFSVQNGLFSSNLRLRRYYGFHLRSQFVDSHLLPFKPNVPFGVRDGWNSVWNKEQRQELGLKGNRSVHLTLGCMQQVISAAQLLFSRRWLHTGPQIWNLLTHSTFKVLPSTYYVCGKLVS